MLLELDAGRVASGALELWGGLVVSTDAGFVVRGDEVGATDVYLSIHRDRVLVSNSLDELVEYLVRRDGLAPISPCGISGLLQRGFAPLPYTEFDGVSLLTMGDTVLVTWEADGPHIDLTSDYPWFTANSQSDRLPDEATLLSLLTRSTSRAIESAGGSGLLMLSSGNDSVAIALAAAEAGYRDIRCVTYSSGPDDPEPPVAAAVCKRLGLSHQIVEMSSDPDWIKTTLTRFFTESVAAGADLAQIPLVMAAAASESEGGVSMAGDGNDSYMGSLVKSRRSLKASLRIRGRRLAGVSRRVIPVDSPLNYIARSKLEAGLPGRMMRFHESRRLLPTAVDTAEFWWQLSKETSHMNRFDAYSTFDKHFTVPSSMKKHALASRAIGHEPAFPWCDHEIADYCFNLPVEYRYDEEAGVSKILLQRMLRRFLDIDVHSIGSRYFAFDGQRFVTENDSFVRAEINQCGLWERDGVDMVNGWINKVGNRPFLYHPILTVFMISGWYNHSRFLPPATTLVETP